MKKALLLFLLILTSSVFGAENAPLEVQASKEQAKAVMDGVYDTFLQVIPYTYGDEASWEILKKNPKKKEELIKHLSDLSEFFKNAKHVEYFQRPGFRPSLDSMNNHLSDTLNSIHNNNYMFAQRRLSALTSLCISCHSQLSSDGAKNAFGNAIKKTQRTSFESDYAFANYLFLIRNFEEAEKYLKLSAENALQKSLVEELYLSLKRMMSIHTKIDFNYIKSKAIIEKYQHDARMPFSAKEMVKSWSKSIVQWKDFKSSKIEDIELFIKKYLSPLEELKEQTGRDNDITLLISSGVLSKYLNDHPKSSSTPQILYWLSIAEKHLSSTYYFTLSDLYLKDCITLHSKSPFAKKCYRLYEDSIEFGYTGSAGVDIPADEKRELVRLKNFIK